MRLYLGWGSVVVLDSDVQHLFLTKFILISLFSFGLCLILETLFVLVFVIKVQNAALFIIFNSVNLKCAGLFQFLVCLSFLLRLQVRCVFYTGFRVASNHLKGV